MNKINNRKKKGFTLAELMLVIAITGILAAFGFIAVTRYMRILEHMKYDAIAKEIFISAQNHLSMANNEGYLDTDKNKLGTKEGKRAGFEDITDEDSGVYYYVVNGKNDVDQANSLISIMLPFGAIDETVRTEGSYIIRYNKETAQVMDVFYSEKTNTRYGHEFSDLYTESSDTSSGSSSQSLMNLRDEDDKNIRRYYKKETNGSTSVIGYYGGTEGNPLYGDKIPLPFIRVDNAEELKVTIKTSGLSPTATLQLFIEGELSTDGEGTSRNKKMLVLKKSNEIDKREYEIVLDSITQKIIDSSNEANSINHFNNLFGDDGFIPGENLIIYAVASDNTVLTNIAKTVEIKTNSLFGDNSTIAEGVDAKDRVATITNIRHLENLESEISSVSLAGLFGSIPSDMTDHAVQESDLDWNDFAKKTQSSDGKTYIYSENGSTLTTNLYYPVELKTNYNGNGNKISNVNANSGNSGLFSSVVSQNISNLQLVDFTITGSGYAGALAGSISSSSIVNNVVAYENQKYSYIVGGGATGGLIGYCENSTVDRSAAAVFVRGGNTGGLIGYSTGSSVMESYSGAHTRNGVHLDSIDVIGSSNAGGLIGYSTGTTLTSVYSTASVDGSSYAGGLVGYYGGSAINRAYAVGYVVADDENKDSKGGFIGYDASGSNHSGCGFMLIANDGQLSAIGNKTENTAVSKLDATKFTYTSFVVSKTDATACGAKPYDQYLKDVYSNKYQYQGIDLIKTSGSLTSDYFVKEHYGDWPDYELQVVNQ